MCLFNLWHDIKDLFLRWTTNDNQYRNHTKLLKTLIYNQETQRWTPYSFRTLYLQLTQHIDGMCADNVLAELHIESVADHHQSSLVGVHHGCSVRHGYPASLGSYSVALRSVANTLSTNQPLDVCWRIATGRHAGERYNISHASLRRSWYRHMGWCDWKINSVRHRIIVKDVDFRKVYRMVNCLLAQGTKKQESLSVIHVCTH